MLVRLAVALCAVVLITGCSDPKSTPLPKDLAQMEGLKPKLEKLTPEERELLASYMMRKTVGEKLGAAFGGKEAGGIPDGTTIGKAIEDQRNFLAERRAEEERQKALAAKLKAEREAAMQAMRDAVMVTLVSKKLAVERGFSGIVMDENLNVTFGYQNNSGKDIAGVKGTVVINDIFGEKLSAFGISNDAGLKVGETKAWNGSRSVRMALGHNQDRKLAELPEDKYKVVWEPEMIVFADGTKLTAPEQ
jgi:hypothetical protein